MKMLLWYSRPTHPGDGRASQQVELWLGRVLLLVLRGAAVLLVRGAADGDGAARRGGLRSGGGARVFLLSAVPGSSRRARPRLAA